MIHHQYWGAVLAGIGAGIVTGLFGTGGGMVLVPLLGLLTSAKEEEIFPCSICVTLPLCVVTLISTPGISLEIKQVLPHERLVAEVSTCEKHTKGLRMA